MKRVLIVADHTLVVHAFRLALRQTAGFHVVGFVDGRKGIEPHLRAVRPDVLLVDDMQNPQHPLERLREISAVTPDATAVLVTLREDDEWLEEAFRVGATAVVRKSVHPVALGTLVREIVNGNVVHRPRRPRVRPSPEDLPLTARELEILRLAAKGYTNSRIARQLWVTEQTVKFHLSNTYRKLGVTNRTEASRFAYTHDLVDAEPTPELAAS